MNAQLAAAAQTLGLEGFEVWATPSKKSFRTNASLELTSYILQGLGYTVSHNTSYSKSATGEFVTLVK